MPPEARLRRILYPLTAALILGYFLFFTWRSIGLYFDQDDVMNLYFAWSKPLWQLLKANLFFWSDFYRPAGAVFYRSIYAIAGFHPLPFRVACFALGIFNLGMCFRFAKLVTATDRVAAPAVLLFAFQSRLMEVWYRTSVVYDLLCFAFFYLAACLYIGVRREGRHPSARRWIAIVCCYVCALNSKEAAVALPVVLLAWEALFSGFRLKNFALPITLGLMNVPYIIGKTMCPGALTNIPDYQPEYSWPRFAHSWSIFLDYLFLQTNRITPAMAIMILALLLALAVALRWRELMFAWVLLFVSTLPVVFLAYRGGFVLYVGYVGWCLYAATILVRLEDFFPHRTAVACVVFVLVAWRYGKWQLHDQRSDPRAWLYEQQALVHTMADQMRALHPRLRRGVRTLLVNDEFTTGEATPYFIVKLLYGDDTMVVDRVKTMPEQQVSWIGYDYVFTCEKGRCAQLKPLR